MKPKDILTKEFLEKEFIEKRKSVHAIAKEHQIASPNSVTQFLKKFELFRSDLRDVGSKLTPEYLIESYVVKKKTLREIAEESGFSRATVSRHINKLKIDKRYRTYESDKLTKYWDSKKKGYEKISGQYWSTVISSAKSRNLDMNITPKEAWEIYEKQNGKCALTDIPIWFKERFQDRSTQTASLDRIDSSKGYTKENCQWVHKKVNIIKMDLDDEEFILWCSLIYYTALEKGKTK